MEFTCEKVDYNVAEFYDKFAKDLPKIVMVNQGFYGEISADTFDRGQGLMQDSDKILRFHTVSQQSRICAKAEHNKATKFFSIPLTYQHHFCVVKSHGRVGKELPLSQIIRDHTLPVHVQFPKNKSISVGSHCINTNNLPTMELTRAFNEICMLGNFIIDGVLSNEITHVPLYLSQLRFSLINGIHGHGRDRWRSYQEELNRSTLILEFDREFGNPDIAEYNPDRVEKVAIDADLEYAKIEPNLYTNFQTIFRVQAEARSPIPVMDTPHDTDPDVYEIISHPDDNPVKMTSFRTELASAITTQKRPPPTAPKPKQAVPTPSETSERMSGPPPTVPGRETREPARTQQKPVKYKEKEHVYANEPVRQPQSKPSPPALSKARSDPLPPPPTQRNVVPQEPRTAVQMRPEDVLIQPEVIPGPPGEKTTVNVDSLSINEVCDYMKSLKLDKYIDSFKENLIDGKLLKELDKDVLKSDFGMSAIESIRLMKFIEEGHIPT